MSASERLDLRRRAADAGSRPAHVGPIDFVHLERQTFGDAALQRQVLALFAEQAVMSVERIRAAATVDERRSLAHALVGAARGVGAFAVAGIAGVIEHGEDGCGEDTGVLERAVREACAVIASRTA